MPRLVPKMSLASAGVSPPTRIELLLAPKKKIRASEPLTKVLPWILAVEFCNCGKNTRLLSTLFTTLSVMMNVSPLIARLAKTMPRSPMLVIVLLAIVVVPIELLRKMPSFRSLNVLF